MRQPLRGHRAGLDAAILQAAVPEGATGHAVDMGTGCGVVAFCLAARHHGLRVTGFDADPEILSLARAGLDLPANAGFADRVRLVDLDAEAGRNEREAAGLPDDFAHWAVMNPPFDNAAAIRASVEPLRRRARVAETAGIEPWLRCASGLLKAGGRLAIIHRTTFLPEILKAADGRFGGLRILPVHPRAGEPAGRIVVGMVQGSSSPMAILPGIVVHDDSNAHTPQMTEILRGEQVLNLW